MVDYYAFADDPHSFTVGERVVAMDGTLPESDKRIGTVVNVTKQRVSVKFDNGEFRHYYPHGEYREHHSGRGRYSLQYASHIIGNPIIKEGKEVKPNTIVFAYYDTNVSTVVHLDDGVGQPSCGTLYGEQGEFFHSTDEYEAGVMRAWGVDPEKITCKKCQRIFQKGGKK